MQGGGAIVGTAVLPQIFAESLLNKPGWYRVAKATLIGDANFIITIHKLFNKSSLVQSIGLLVDVGPAFRYFTLTQLYNRTMGSDDQKVDRVRFVSESGNYNDEFYIDIRCVNNSGVANNHIVTITNIGNIHSFQTMEFYHPFETVSEDVEGRPLFSYEVGDDVAGTWAEAATKDQYGNAIAKTYATKEELKNKPLHMLNSYSDMDSASEALYTMFTSQKLYTKNEGIIGISGRNYYYESVVMAQNHGFQKLYSYTAVNPIVQCRVFQGVTLGDWYQEVYK